MDDGHHGNKVDEAADDDGDNIVQSRKRRRFDSDEDGPAISDIIDDEHSNQSDARLATPMDDQLTNEVTAPPAYFKKPGPVFSERMIDKCHAPFQSSSTPEHLQHRFMVSQLYIIQSYSPRAYMIVLRGYWPHIPSLLVFL